MRVVLSVDVKDGIATLSFNPAFESGYGTDDERTMIEGLQRTMGQFTDVQKIEIVVDGKNIESLGNIEISEPLDVLREDSLARRLPVRPHGHRNRSHAEGSPCEGTEQGRMPVACCRITASFSWTTELIPMMLKAAWSEARHWYMPKN